MRKLIPFVFLAACSDPVLGEARVFRDNFDALDTLWTFTGEHVSIEGGRLRMTAGVGSPPLAEYTLPTPPFGPGWNLEFSVATTAGVPCPIVVISTGDEQRHAWALEMNPSRNYWGFQVGDGGGWETIGYSLGGDEGPEHCQCQDVGRWGQREFADRRSDGGRHRDPERSPQRR